jgi:hypothetical protein
MHDWVLVSMFFDWHAARVTLSFRQPDGNLAAIVAEGVSHLDAPRFNDWGPSVSVNRLIGPVDADTSARGARRIAIEMQSGDVITVLAASFVLPHPATGDAPGLARATAGK